MSRFDRHINKGDKLVLDGEEFYIKAIGTGFIPDFMTLAKSFSDKKGEFDIKDLDSDSVNSLKRVIEKTMELSFPNESKEEREIFGMQYMNELLPIIFQLNSPNTKDKEKLEKLKSLNNA
jgi:hypothetical protein